MAPKAFIDKVLLRLGKVDRTRLEGYLKGLRDEIRFLEKCLNGLKIGILILSNDDRVLYLNGSGELILGISFVKVEGLKISGCPLDDTLSAFIQKVIEKDESDEIQIKVAFPFTKLLRVTGMKVSVDDEKKGYLFSIEDITELKRMGAHKIQTEKLKALLGMGNILAHELGNPLNSLGIHLQLLKREIDKLSVENKKDMIIRLDTAIAEVRRLDEILTRFLQAARPLKPQFMQMDLNTVLDDTINFVLPELGSRGISVEKRYRTDLPQIWLDYVQLRQAFFNIIKNAMEAMEEGGKLTVITAKNGNYVKVVFKDTGCGIPEEVIEKIVEPYYTTKEKGSGLGLMIVHRIIKEHGGIVDIDSKIGDGTTVTILLPVTRKGPKPLPSPKRRRKRKRS